MCESLWNIYIDRICFKVICYSVIESGINLELIFDDGQCMILKNIEPKTSEHV